MRQFTLALLTAGYLLAADGTADLYSSKDLNALRDKLAQKQTQFASENLKRYGNHYTMLAYRDGTGSAEVHEHEADVFFVQDGQAEILLGGKLVNSKMEKTGELRGTSIEGGERRALGTGDVIHIPAGTPHQLLVEKGKPFTYFVVKVSGQ